MFRRRPSPCESSRLPRGQQFDPEPDEQQSAGALGLMRLRADAEAAMKPAHAERIDAVNDDGAGTSAPAAHAVRSDRRRRIDRRRPRDPCDPRRP
ncbi:hypothetical protein Bamb_4409 [Burkholderia ambifaria AMMD]|uniref:Uncharacterized protein n=1 Tax=Burkholderia ambifaria (strain ATCC BAA-244 / DSM 16087 / CCUG 44356 / LMG 19182 / AMMD) TaxID=339670 RepID=Q0B7B2_BURCM|nr:hypothetical protein Bamb_4409 [Burkholderia ambifaria AMMD]